MKKVSFALLGIACLLLPASPVFALSQTGIQNLPNLRPVFKSKVHASAGSALTQTASENWSGYAATGANNSFSSVSSSWTEPTLNCVVNPTAYAAFWVGLDGYNDQTVEQIGSEANCVNGKVQNYTWYEMYPQNPYEVVIGVAVAAGNKISATVSYNQPTVSSRGRFHSTNNAGSFTLKLTDLSTGVSYSTTQTPTQTTDRSSAEVIAEAPYSNGILPLADFGLINYASSEINGSVLGNAPGLQEITLEDPHGMVATPSALDVTKQNFSVTWSDPS